jgi:myo-inositol-1(or 4)-monophosphatase
MIRSLSVSVAILIALSASRLSQAEDKCENWVGTVAKRTELANLVEKTMRSAGDKLLEIRDAKDFQILKKQNFADIKSKGDCVSQEIILKSLLSNEITKNASILAEEDCKQTKEIQNLVNTTTSATWLLDPIDGTTNYVHGIPHFSISLALVVEGKPCFAAIYSPVYNEFYFAFEHHKAFLKKKADGQPVQLSVSDTPTLNGSLWITGTEGGPKDPAIEKNRNTFDIALELLPQTHDLRRTGSASLDLASVASGKAEAYFELSEGLNWWDIAGGILLVTEAGGRVSVQETGNPAAAERMKRPIDYVLATNGQSEIHSTFQNLITKKLRK